MVASLPVEKPVHVLLMVPAVKNTADVQRVARIDSEGAIVPRVSVEAANAHALLLIGSVTRMSAEIAGLVVVMAPLGCLLKEAIITSAGT